jgi:hypothetical protein
VVQSRMTAAAQAQQQGQAYRTYQIRYVYAPNPAFMV